MLSTPNHLTLISHNAFWLQGYPFEPETPGPPRGDVAAGLARLYTVMAADIICLQEMQSPEAMNTLAHSLESVHGHHAPGRTQQAYGGAILSRLPMETLLSANPAPVRRLWQLAVITLPGGHRLTIANAHLASARQLGPEEGARSRLEDIRNALATLPAPDIIAGDFNEGPDGDVAAYLTRNGYADVAHILDWDITSTGVNKDRSDMVWVADAWRGRVIDGWISRWETLACALPGVTFLSDHLPLCVRFRCGHE